MGLSSSKELDVLSIEAGELGDSLAQSPQYEELVEVLSRAVAKLNINLPAERQEAHKKSELDEHFLQSTPQPPRQGLPLFQDLHTEVSEKAIFI